MKPCCVSDGGAKESGWLVRGEKIAAFGLSDRMVDKNIMTWNEEDGAMS